MVKLHRTRVSIQNALRLEVWATQTKPAYAGLKLNLILYHLNLTLKQIILVRARRTSFL
jgi:hypothetical protein